MRKIALVMLVVFSSGTMAEWTKVNSDEMGAQYIDLGRMQRNGELVKIWTVIDYKEPRKMLGKIFRSVVVQEEYDCENELQRVLFVVANSGQMAAGAAVISGSSHLRV